MENGHEAAVELPDDGISKAQLDAIEGSEAGRHQLCMRRDKVGRFD